MPGSAPCRQQRQTQDSLHRAGCAVHEAVLRVDLSRCMLLTYLLPLFSWGTHEQGCSGRAVRFQQELSTLISLAEPPQT